MDGIPIEMNLKSYAAALQLIRLMEFDDSLAAAAEPFNWYHNLIHQMFDYEENNFNRSQLIQQLVNQPCAMQLPCRCTFYKSAFIMGLALILLERLGI